MSGVRVGIVGCGKIADQHAAQIKRIPSARIVGVCDSERLMAEQLAERFDADGSYDDIGQLLKEAQPNVVHITTPPQSHYSLTRASLEAGCHVYVEKPFSLNLQEAESMVALAEERGLRLMAGHNVQFNPEMVRMRELVRAGAIGGDPVHIESVFSYDLSDPSYVPALLGDEKHWVRALPGKLLHNLISHGLAKVVEFLKPPARVMAVQGLTSPTLRAAGENNIVDELRVLICDSRETTAYFTFTTQISPVTQELRIYGRRGALVVDNVHRTVLELNRSNSEFKSYAIFFIPIFRTAQQHVRNLWRNGKAFLRADFHMDAGMKNLIEEFYRCIETGAEPPISTREILLTASLMDDIFRQLEWANGAAGNDRLHKLVPSGVRS